MDQAESAAGMQRGQMGSRSEAADTVVEGRLVGATVLVRLRRTEAIWMDRQHHLVRNGVGSMAEDVVVRVAHIQCPADTGRYREVVQDEGDMDMDKSDARDLEMELEAVVVQQTVRQSLPETDKARERDTVARVVNSR